MTQPTPTRTRTRVKPTRTVIAEEVIEVKSLKPTDPTAASDPVDLGDLRALVADTKHLADDSVVTAEGIRPLGPNMFAITIDRLSVRGKTPTP